MTEPRRSEAREAVITMFRAALAQTSHGGAPDAIADYLDANPAARAALVAYLVPQQEDAPRPAPVIEPGLVAHFREWHPDHDVTQCLEVIRTPSASEPRAGLRYDLLRAAIRTVLERRRANVSIPTGTLAWDALAVDVWKELTAQLASQPESPVDAELRKALERLLYYGERLTEGQRAYNRGVADARATIESPVEEERQP